MLHSVPPSHRPTVALSHCYPSLHWVTIPLSFCPTYSPNPSHCDLSFHPTVAGLSHRHPSWSHHPTVTPSHCCTIPPSHCHSITPSLLLSSGGSVTRSHVPPLPCPTVDPSLHGSVTPPQLHHPTIVSSHLQSQHGTIPL
ncbi:hypothetical protein FA95DRAFT_1420031 [Auriscalpium vulgare]|uniref:Uncharacterized protein n=1 Tax=Auriscalpium vulgare TaxID=40419 RepID=A0ACB8R1Z7_9AGAM|nr:hypothetical protein FA95DRAFT_1420031 [Auriscalpium vulgare]